MNIIRRAIAAIALLAALTGGAAAQSACPYIAYGAVLTAGQWNQCFANKQDALGYVPVNKAGDVLLGKLTMFQSAVTGAGLNLPQGSAPTSPANGDLWATIAGLFVRINGFTYGPLAGANSTSFAATEPITVTFPSNIVTYAFDYAHVGVFTAAQSVNLNTASLPSSITGTGFTVGAADGVAGRIQIDAFGAIAAFTGAVYGGTAAAPTAVTSGTQLTGINGYAYNGATLVGPIASFRTYAAENIASGHQGSKACIATTPNASTTLADGLCQQNDAGITVGSPTGGSEGANTLNVQGAIYQNGTAIGTGPFLPLAGGTMVGSILFTDNTFDIGASGATRPRDLFLGRNAVIGGTSTLSGALTYGGVTLSNSVTGTGSMALSAGPTFTGTLSSANHTITSASANALAVGLAGTTNPAFNVDASTASSATGINIKSAAAAGGAAISVLSSGTDENLKLDAKGAGTISIGSVSTGAITHTRATTLSAALTYGGVTLSNSVTGTGSMALSASPTFTGTLSASIGAFSSTLTSTAHTITSASATALAVGLNGATTPALQVDASTATSITGIKIKSAATGGGVAISAIGEATNGNLTIDAQGSGTITLGATSTGAITLTRATTLSGALTYGGITLANSVTGTGNMVLSAGPTISGNVTVQGVTSTGATGTGRFVFDNTPTLITPLLGVATATSIAVGGGSIGTDALEVNGTTTHNGALSVVSGALSTSGNISAAAWTTSGIRRKAVAASYTDTSSSGTVATAYTDLQGASTILASSATVYTNYFGAYFVDPVASTNVTMTNKWSIGGDSAKFGTSNQFSVGTTGHVTAEGVTSTGATGTGKFVFDASPSISSLTVTTGFTATGLVTNAALATMAAATVKLNATAGTAAPTDSTIQGLTNLAAPSATLDFLLIYDHAAGTLKSVTPGAIATSSVAGVSSLNALTGALSIAAGYGTSVAAGGSTVTVANVYSPLTAYAMAGGI